MIVLDTHALVWWVSDDDQLSSKAVKAIKKELDDEVGEIIVSSISTWEIALLVEKKRLKLTMDVDEWIQTVSMIDKLKFIPVDNQIAIQSVRLPGEFHPDPADRLITALARHLSAALITSDKKIRNYKYVKTVW
ncbi:MAG: type II toxin-antitoxin system VapC family toxin [Gammaproteobacteria bacterium]|jgi:PIN domain nuclease of toxin-antitoxin system